MLPLHHIQRAIHAFFADVNEQALHLMMRHPECEAEAQRIVRKSNTMLRQHIGALKSTNWEKNRDEEGLKRLCQSAQENSLELMRRIQTAPSRAHAGMTDQD